MDEEAPPNAPSSPERHPIFLHARREPFEFGLLPIPKLIFSDGTLTLAPIKQKLIEKSSQTLRIDAQGISETLQISIDHARLVLDTLSAVLPSDSDPLVTAKPDELDSIGANVNDLILFLYIQSYKRLVPRTHKDSAAVADVWPSTSAFDGYLSVLSPLQFVRSNSRRFMPSQVDEEAHQLSYLQKHMANILTLLAEPAEDEGDESLVLSCGRFEHLGFLIQFGEKGADYTSLSQTAPFFANSDPDMPAAPVSATQAHDWIVENISASLEHNSEKISAKENGPAVSFDVDVTMSDVGINHPKGPTNSLYSRCQTFIEGVSKTSILKQGSDIKGSCVKVLNCHESVIYILAPLKYATVYGCSDATIVLGAIGKALRVEHCERLQVITASKRISIANCRECIFFLGINQRPLILGDNHKLQVAPFNTFYPQLEEHMALVGIDPTINKWNEPLVLGMVDPHDSLSHPAGVSDVQSESATCLGPEQFTNFVIPKWFTSEASKATEHNPFPLPDPYLESQRKNSIVLDDIRHVLRNVQLEESRKRELASALHVYFKDWLYATGNIRQLYCLHGD